MRRVVRCNDQASLAQAVAQALVEELARKLARQPSVSVVLTGGGIGIASLQAVSALTTNCPTAAPVDWSRVDVWWGDERFLPSGDPERNDTQAEQALLNKLPLDPTRVHRIAAPGAQAEKNRTTQDQIAQADAAALSYAHDLQAAAIVGTSVSGESSEPGDGGERSQRAQHTGHGFDVVLLGVGPDGHIASLFPGHAALQASVADASALVLPVFDSPKPPPTRISLGLGAINSAAQVWLLAAGQPKADAVAQALGGSQPPLPAALVQGREQTVWWLDDQAASQLNPTIYSIW